ncbi:MAG: hypothetical protein LAT52_07430 [Balneolales bacterium]|nr:hypothetical protein [Balneolales bacterium]
MSTRMLAGTVGVLSVVYGALLLHGDHGHGGGHAHHHHHHDHEHMEYTAVLDARPEQITFIEAVYPAGRWLLRLEDSVLNLYEGDVRCDGSLPDETPVQIASRREDRLQAQWRTFFSNMTPDAHIEPEAKAESYGLDNPVSCMRIGVMRNDGEEVVRIQFGDLTVQGMNQYIVVNTTEDILLIPRYFWQQVRLQMNS